MKFLLFSCVVLLSLADFVKLDSTECPEDIENELQAVVRVCIPDEDDITSRTISPEEQTTIYNCILNESTNQPELAEMLESCDANADVVTRLSCLGGQLYELNCIPNSS